MEYCLPLTIHCVKNEWRTVLSCGKVIREDLLSGIDIKQGGESIKFIAAPYSANIIDDMVTIFNMDGSFSFTISATAYTKTAIKGMLVACNCCAEAVSIPTDTSVGNFVNENGFLAYDVIYNPSGAVINHVTTSVTWNDDDYLHGAGSPPITGTEAGQEYLDTNTGNVYQWNGSSWNIIYQNPQDAWASEKVPLTTINQIPLPSVSTYIPNSLMLNVRGFSAINHPDFFTITSTHIEWNPIVMGFDVKPGEYVYLKYEY